MFGIIPLVLILSPLIFQLIFGRKAIVKSTTLEFGTVSLISIILQIVLTIIAYSVASYNYNKYFEEHPNTTRCGMGSLALFGFTILCFTILLLVMIIQYFVKRYYEKTQIK
ncbi:hypothetical protein ASC72_01240 [Flavobacterium sp. Root420]|nr:hypothetical protein ASC72_01240 [Flavobacterium sp. Root420]